MGPAGFMWVEKCCTQDLFFPLVSQQNVAVMRQYGAGKIGTKRRAAHCLPVGLQGTGPALIATLICYCIGEWRMYGTVFRIAG